MYNVLRNKVRDIGKNRFENIIAEFAPKFENLKPLARELRSALFLIRDRDIFIGIFHDYNIIYNRIINVFSRAVDRLWKGGVGNYIGEVKPSY
jgi:hypothetical protein